jgi:glycosyltransferase involved in cell wall biosynthesis
MFDTTQGPVPILLVGNFLAGKYGTRGVCEDLALRLSAAGHPVISTSNKVSRPLRLLDMIATTLCKKDSYQVALVDVYSGNAFRWAEAVCGTLRRIGKPYALTLHGGGLPDFARRSPSRVKRLLQSAVLVTTPSRFLYDCMAPFRGDLYLQPNPLDLSSYDYRPRSTVAPRLVWLRAFHEIYNPSLAPQVLGRLLVDSPSASLVMIGPDKSDGSLKTTQDLARALNVDDRVLFPGPVPKEQVARWLNEGDIFINTASVDNAPVSVLEAMACGLCIVSTNVGGIPYLLEDQEDALLVPPNDPEAMATAVMRLLKNPHLAARLSANARLKAERHDWSRILPKWQELLTKAAST